MSPLLLFITIALISILSWIRSLMLYTVVDKYPIELLETENPPYLQPINNPWSGENN
jgi:hypothetical protein